MKLLSPNELRLIRLVNEKAVSTLKALDKPLSSYELDKSLTNYEELISDNKKMLEGVVKKAFNVKRDLSIKVSDLINLSDSLSQCLSNVKALNKLKKKLLKSLNEFLKDYGINLITPKVKYSLKPKSSKALVVLPIEDLSTEKLILEVLRVNKTLINKTLFRTEQDLVNADVVKSFIADINITELKKAANKTELKDLLLKVYVTLRQQAINIQSLNARIKKYSRAGSMNELVRNHKLLEKEIDKACSELIQALSVYKKALELGLKDRIVKKYVFNKLIEDPKGLINSFLIANYEVPDLINQLAYEFLVSHDSINQLSGYSEFSRRAPFLFIKRFTA